MTPEEEAARRRHPTHLRTTCYRCGAPGVRPYDPEVDNEFCADCADHGDHTFVRIIEDPLHYQAQCGLCEWRGPIRDTDSYSLAVADGQGHAFGTGVRERARAAAEVVLGNDPTAAPALVADAVSDVWERLKPEELFDLFRDSL